jgi:hypothetical protein
MMTDEALLYRGIGRDFSGHGCVNRGEKEYVKTADSTI